MMSGLLATFVLLHFTAYAAANRELVLALEDTFEDFNLSLWKHELTLGGGGNFEFQWYTNNRTNSYVEDGVLHIMPTLTANDIGDAAVRGGSLNIWGTQPPNLCTGNMFYGCERNAGASGNYLNPVKSARIRTAESFSFTYGKVEIRAKLPRGDWLWPAIWMLPTDEQYGSWPASGEIDIMESRGNPPEYAPGGYNSYGSTLHWGVNVHQNQFPQTNQATTQEQKQDFTSDFHTYGLIWNETHLIGYLDTEDNPVLEVPIMESFFDRGGWNQSVWSNPWRGRGNNAPFDRKFFLLINLAVGGVGGYFPDGAGKPWNNTDPDSVNKFYNAKDDWFPTWTQSFQIDSVRVWTYKDTEPTTGMPTTPTSSAMIQFLTSSTFTLVMLSLALSVGVFKVLN